MSEIKRPLYYGDKVIGYCLINQAKNKITCFIKTDLNEIIEPFKSKIPDNISIGFKEKNK